MTGAAYLLDKSAGISSRKAASKVAQNWGYRKFGHAGTLDPDATGMLIVLLGKATRLARFIVSSRKTYSFGIALGIRTDTDDTSGTVLEQRPVPYFDREAILSVLSRYTGEVKQKVPGYSAVRIEGVRAYSLAREGIEPSTPVRDVRVEDWILNEITASTIRFTVTVSSGTYVRALARDIGNELGTGGAAFDIRRTSVGEFRIEEASERTDCETALLGMSSLMRGYASTRIDEERMRTVSNGGSISGQEAGIVALTDSADNLLAVAEGNGSILRPLCVFIGG
jgi:tRNA pseudouridine55 synthase